MSRAALLERLYVAGFDELTAALLAEGRVVRVVHHNRETGTAIVVRDFGTDCDPEVRWSTTCLTHLTECGHHTRRLAVWHAAEPSGWCGLCREIAERRREESK